jgi:hypothetical protein
MQSNKKKLKEKNKKLLAKRVWRIQPRLINALIVNRKLEKNDRFY